MYAMEVRVILIALISFLAGLYLGIQLMGNSFVSSCQLTAPPKAMRQNSRLRMELTNDEKLEKCHEKVESLKTDLAVLQKERSMNQDGSRLRLDSSSQPLTPRFGPKVARLATGAVRVQKDEFMKAFDYGLPLELQDQPDSTEVLFLYPNEKTLPSDNKTASAAVYNDGKTIPVTSVKEATSNCNDLNIVHIKKEGKKGSERCLAVVASQGAHHVLRWRKNDETLEFERVGLRGEKGRFMAVPDEETEKLHRIKMKAFLDNVDDALEDLKPIVNRIATNQTVVVMACNIGYATMLMNFVCSARARGINLSNLLVFATDKESFNLAQQLGLAAFHTEKVLGKMPTEMAKGFGDKIFGQMTYAQMLSVLLVNMLGFDVLFQDCDVIWYKDPLELFSNKTSELQDFDVIFMDDGNGSWEFVPFRANTGFFYVRQNERTRYLFTDFLFSGDLVDTVQVDQIVMSSLLNHHSTMHGLKVKTMDWHTLPGGREYHQERAFVNNIIDDSQNEDLGVAGPWAFHMHWTWNRTDKVGYMRQSGMWYLNDKCVDKKAKEIVNAMAESGYNGSMPTNCCSLTPLVSCYHPEKPSVKSCRK